MDTEIIDLNPVYGYRVSGDSEFPDIKFDIYSNLTKLVITNNSAFLFRDSDVLVRVYPIKNFSLKIET